MCVWKSDENFPIFAFFYFFLLKPFCLRRFTSDRHTISSKYQTPRTFSKIFRVVLFFFFTLFLVLDVIVKHFVY